ncbi:MAG TPA: glycosyltransferase [Nitrososphaera sp.]|jgi:cellulose synthase/poly-beta-1,6-N-acetylglucosamine synthase-like glycosyltransferase
MSRLDQVRKLLPSSLSSSSSLEYDSDSNNSANNKDGDEDYHHRTITPQDSGTLSLFAVRMVMLIATATIGTLKALLVVLGIIDLIVGIYGMLVISLFFVAFFLAYSKYRDPSKIQQMQGNNSSTNNNEQQQPRQQQQQQQQSIIINADSTASPLTQSHHYQPEVSIIIPVYNEEHLIKETVKACLEAAYPPEKIEVILVNDGSTDGTYAVLDSLKRDHGNRVKIVHLPRNAGKRKAIKEGILQGQARGEIIVLVDSDSAMDRLAIQRLVDAFSGDPDLGAATGHGRVKNAGQNMLTRIQETWYDGQFSIMKGMESTFDTVSCCSGILSAYRREAIMPCLDRWSDDKFLGVEFSPGDDRHLTAYVLGGTRHYIDKSSKVWKVKYVSSAVTYTAVPSTLRQLARQQTRWKKSWIRMFCFNLPFYFKYRPASAASIYCLQTALSFVAPVVAFRSLVWLPLEGDFTNAVVYLSGIFFIGILFAVEYKLRHPDSGNTWLYRLVLPAISISILNNLLFYALMTIKKRSWLTR